MDRLILDRSIRARELNGFPNLRHVDSIYSQTYASATPQHWLLIVNQEDLAIIQKLEDYAAYFIDYNLLANLLESVPEDYLMRGVKTFILSFGHRTGIPLDQQQTEFATIESGNLRAPHDVFIGQILDTIREAGVQLGEVTRYDL